jgi:hypothetical protein
MDCCLRCGNAHIGSLILAPPGFRFLFQQEFEQWCDENLTDPVLDRMARDSIRMVRLLDSRLSDFIAMANIVPVRH